MRNAHPTPEHFLPLLVAAGAAGNTVASFIVLDCDFRHGVLSMAAGDHHCYPGGLFDQSVKAAELAFASEHSNDTERGVAAMGALLFDLGKVFDDELTNDGNRLRGVLLPHRLTRMRLQRAYDVAEAVQPGPAALLRAVLEANPGSAIGGPPEAARLAHSVRSAVERAFGLESRPRV